MKLFVPSVGCRMILTKPWTFDLFFERRNGSLLDFVLPIEDDDKRRSYWSQYEKEGFWSGTYEECNRVWHPPILKRISTTLSPGTELVVDRVYIRATNRTKDDEESYDSLSFRIAKSPDLPTKKKFRFWVKLYDANNIEFELAQEKV